MREREELELEELRLIYCQTTALVCWCCRVLLVRIDSDSAWVGVGATLGAGVRVHPLGGAS